jgi:RNA polymerase sigma-70 factor (ECF subfamily)
METDTIDLLAVLATDVDRAFEALVFIYQDQLYTFVLRQVRSPQDAEDIVQETFLQVYHALKRYPPERIRALALRPWIYKIARYIWYNRLRHNKLQQISLETMEDTMFPEQEEERPDILVEELEARHELEALVKQLPLHYSEAISLYYFEHFTYQEIAYLLNQSMGTVKAHLHRGIQRLRQACITREHETRSIDGTNAAP